MWELDHEECWTPKNQCFELWCWGRLLKVPWGARRSHQLIRKEINPEYSLKGLMLKPWYFAHLMQKADSSGRTLRLGKMEGRRRREQWRMRWLDGNTNSMDMCLSGLQALVINREAWHSEVHGVTRSWTRLRDWTENELKEKWEIEGGWEYFWFV